MTRRMLQCLSAAFVAFTMMLGDADAANFWLSTTGPGLGAGSAPPATASQIAMVPHAGSGANGTLYIWARPDAAKTLQNWSLRVTSSDSSVVELTGSAVRAFDSPQSPPQVRWEHVSEPSGGQGGIELADLRGFMGINGDQPSVGIGPSSKNSDQFYYPASDSWLLASIQYDYISADATAASSIYLQIGEAGMNHGFEPSSTTNVVFGALSDAPLNADFQRETNSATPDAIITVSPAPVVTADFDSDGDVDGKDFLTWQQGVGKTGAAATRPAGDSNGDQTINGADLAVWRSRFGTAGNATVSALPEASVRAMALSVLTASVVARRKM